MEIGIVHRYNCGANYLKKEQEKTNTMKQNEEKKMDRFIPFYFAQKMILLNYY